MFNLIAKQLLLLNVVAFAIDIGCAFSTSFRQQQPTTDGYVNHCCRKASAKWSTVPLATLPRCSIATMKPFIPPSTATFSMSEDASSLDSPVKKKIMIVVSSVGGVGEITAIELAKIGHSVRWFSLSSGSSSSSISLPRRMWSAIQGSGGELVITGGDAASLGGDEQRATTNVETWVSNNIADNEIEGIIVTLDTGADERIYDQNEMLIKKELEEAVKRVTQIVCRSLPPNVKRVEIIPLGNVVADHEGNSGDQKNAIKSWIANPFAKKSLSLRDSIRCSTIDGKANIVTLRYGLTYGLPQSNRESSPFLDGPRREPIFREEYINRSITLLPTKKRNSSMQLRTSRLSLANVAIRCLLMLDSTSAKDFPRDITVASREGTALLSESDWNEEIKRFSAAATRSISKDGSIALFEASFDSVPNIAKLADWIAYKWAPTVLTTYDIAGIRKGARPVYATRVAVEDDGEEAVEIYWQELVNFQETRNVGKMIIRIKNYGIVASRKSLISETAVSESKPFPGENVLIRRLADAASQATEKGLAVKAKLKIPVASKDLNIDVASRTQETKTAQTSSLSNSQPAMEAGPRGSGARRPVARQRGKSSPEQKNTA